MMLVWLSYRSGIRDRLVSWTCIHDALVVAEACGHIFTKRDPVEIEVEDDASTKVRAIRDSHIDVCRTVDDERFERWFLDMVCSSIKD